MSTKLGNELIPVLVSHDSSKTITGACHRLTYVDQVENLILIDCDETDEITRAIADRTYTFPPDFSLILDLLRPGQKVLDLGAHIGTFSLFAAARGYQVVGVEAAPRNVALFEASIRQNQFDNVRAVAGAVSNRSGILKFIENGPYSLVARPGLNSPTISVPAFTVDDLLEQIGWDTVDFVKLDVEGSEMAVFQGMTRLLSRDDAPIILYESNGHTLNWAGETPNRLMAALEFFGYHCYLIGAEQLMPAQSDDFQPNCNVDYLAVKHVPDLNASRWHIVPPLPLTERIARIVGECAHANSDVRAYMAHALAQGDIRLLSDIRVRAALNTLQSDPIASVRAAAAWWQEVSERLYPGGSDASVEKDAELMRLQTLVDAYERGRFMRAMRALHRRTHRQ